MSLALFRSSSLVGIGVVVVKLLITLDAVVVMLLRVLFIVAVYCSNTTRNALNNYNVYNLHNPSEAEM